MQKYRENTITDIEQLLKEMDRVRKHGYATAVEEINEGVFAVAVPITDKEDNVLASVVIAMPNFQIDEEKILGLVKICKNVIEDSEVSYLASAQLSYYNGRLKARLLGAGQSSASAK